MPNHIAALSLAIDMQMFTSVFGIVRSIVLRYQTGYGSMIGGEESLEMGRSCRAWSDDDKAEHVIVDRRLRSECRFHILSASAPRPLSLRWETQLLGESLPVS